MRPQPYLIPNLVPKYLGGGAGSHVTFGARWATFSFFLRHVYNAAKRREAPGGGGGGSGFRV